jgi:hypothetical protein
LFFYRLIKIRKKLFAALRKKRREGSKFKRRCSIDEEREAVLGVEERRYESGQPLLFSCFYSSSAVGASGSPWLHDGMPHTASTGVYFFLGESQYFLGITPHRGEP